MWEVEAAQHKEVEQVEARRAPVREEKHRREGDSPEETQGSLRTNRTEM